MGSYQALYETLYSSSHLPIREVNLTIHVFVSIEYSASDTASQAGVSSPQMFVSMLATVFTGRFLSRKLV